MFMKLVGLRIAFTLLMDGDFLNNVTKTPPYEKYTYLERVDIHHTVFFKNIL